MNRIYLATYQSFRGAGKRD